MAELIRIQKLFSDSGILSRRAAEAEILKGNVTVNGRVAQLGDKVDPDQDEILFCGRPIRSRGEKPHRYVLINKPRGIVCTAKDEKGRTPVTSLVRIPDTRLYPVGRLDMDSDGLLLLTDDGKLTNRLTHPRHEIPKIYHVTVSPAPTKDQLAVLRSPMTIDGYRLLPVKIRVLEETVLEMQLYEGRNRQIRKMCDAVGLKVKQLTRVAIGTLLLGDLAPGQWRELTPQEINYLKGASPSERN